MIIKKFLFFLIPFLVSKNALTQISYKAQIDKLGLEDGISSYNITDILQDKRGFIWLSTTKGLNRYDGEEFKVYSEENSNLCYNKIRHIREDINGNIWITADEYGGEARNCILDPEKERFYSLSEYLGDSLDFDISTVFAYQRFKDVLMFSAYKNGKASYYEYDGKKVKLAFHFDYSFSNYMKLSNVFKLNNKEYIMRIWDWRENGKISHIIHLDEKGQLIKRDSCKNRKDQMLFLFSYNEEICTYCLNSAKKEQWSVSYKNIKEESKSVAIKNNWKEKFIYKNNSLTTYNSKELKVYNPAGEIIKKAKLNLEITEGYDYIPFIDKEGNIWHHDDKHLYIISLRPLKFNIELSGRTVPIRTRGITKNKKGNLYTGGVGYIKAQNDQKEWFDLPSPERNYLGMLYDNGKIWIGTEFNDLTLYNEQNKSFRKISKSSDQTNRFGSMVWMPHKTSKGKIWAGCGQGLYKLNENQDQLVAFKDYGKYESLSKSIVYAFHENKEGTWLCTSSGLYLVNLDEEIVLQQYCLNAKGENYIPSNHIAHLYEDPSGIFWLATKGNGLIEWNPTSKKSTNYTEFNSGITNNVLYGIYGDTLGALWISSNRGIIRFDKNSQLVNNFTEAHGLLHDEFNTIAHFKDPSGIIYFGSQNGIVNLKAQHFKNKKKTYPFIISDVYKKTYQNDSIQNIKSSFLKKPVIHIYPNDKFCVLKFALLNYNNIHSNQYSYFLEGYDKKWNYQKNNFIKLSGLPYGTYTLKLRSKTPESSDWVNYKDAIKIKVIKPFYLSWFFLISFSVALGVLFKYLIKLRTLHLLKKQKKLEKLILERTQDIASINKKLSNKNKIIVKQNNEISTLFREAHHRIKNNLQLIISVLHLQSTEASNKEKGFISEATNRINSIAKIHEQIYNNNPLEQFNIEAHFQQLIAEIVHTSGKNVELNIEVKIEEIGSKSIVLCSLLINELITNSIKHVFVDKNPGQISLKFSSDKSKLSKIHYSDNGKWKTPEAGNSIGMNIIESVIKQLGGQYQILKKETATEYIITELNLKA